MAIVGMNSSDRVNVVNDLNIFWIYLYGSDKNRIQSESFHTRSLKEIYDLVSRISYL